MMVNSYTWFIADGRKGMTGMSPEEKGIYRDVLDLIYQKDGNVPDNDQFIAGWIDCDLRIWKRVKATLVERGRIHVHAGVIHDSKCDTRLAKEVARATSQRENSLLGGIAHKAKWNVIKGKTDTYDSPPASPLAGAQGGAPSVLRKKDKLSYFGTTSEHLQPSRELIERETNTRPRPPSSLATAHLDSALPRSAVSEAKLPSKQDSKPSNPANPEGPFSRAEAGKPNGWDWEAKPNGKFYAALGTPEQRAWEDYLGVVRRYDDGGMDYPAQWPPK